MMVFVADWGKLKGGGLKHVEAESGKEVNDWICRLGWR